jgi:hypothetical protein
MSDRSTYKSLSCSSSIDLRRRGGWTSSTLRFHSSPASFSGWFVHRWREAVEPPRSTPLVTQGDDERV